MQIAVTWVFFDAHWRTVTSRLSDGLAGDVAWVVDSYEADPTPLARIADRAEQSLDLSVALQEGRDLPTRRRNSLFGPIDQAINQALSDRLDDPFWFDTTRYPAYVDIRVKVKNGVLRIIAPRDRAFVTHGHIFVMWLSGGDHAADRHRRAVHPQSGARHRAAGRGGRGFRPGRRRRFQTLRRARGAPGLPGLPDMKDRLQRHIEQRTTLLASVSHDLRTPLTRLKLELALTEPSARVEEMKRDLAEMEHMIDEYLAFARGQGGEAVETVAVRRLIEEVSRRRQARRRPGQPNAGRT